MHMLKSNTINKPILKTITNNINKVNIEKNLEHNKLKQLRSVSAPQKIFVNSFFFY